MLHKVAAQPELRAAPGEAPPGQAALSCCIANNTGKVNLPHRRRVARRGAGWRGGTVTRPTAGRRGRLRSPFGGGAVAVGRLGLAAPWACLFARRKVPSLLVSPEFSSALRQALATSPRGRAGLIQASERLGGGPVCGESQCGGLRVAPERVVTSLFVSGRHSARACGGAGDLLKLASCVAR
ncbi:hypothetical protein E2C01_044447 [Portunus trituberculatus]|uniref:Uncharacterized protein n=1 Tax=Portunus trituberculatus TaxID=210409 RepID=A0A5B7FZD6_PORTR|nr:hypothetical protein [Portunus trituberculatus]